MFEPVNQKASFPELEKELMATWKQEGTFQKSLELRGLMAMGPTHGDPAPAFKELRQMRDEAQQRLGRSLPVLSMGMSGDFEVAVKEGSTMLRLGQALFGPRPS